MPNHCTNNLTITGTQDALSKFREENVCEDGYLDFNKAVPMPEKLRGIGRRSVPAADDSSAQSSEKRSILSSDETGLAWTYRYYRYLGEEDFPELTDDNWLSDKEVKELIEEFDPEYLKTQLKSGDPCIWWYPWNIKNWGTKWGPYDQEGAMDTKEDFGSGGSADQYFLHHSFLTAWSPPTDWQDKVAAKYPELTFQNSWHEEGGYLGEHSHTDGKEVANTEHSRYEEVK